MAVDKVRPVALLAQGHHGVGKTLALRQQGKIFFARRTGGVFFSGERHLPPLHLGHVQILAPVVGKKQNLVGRIRRQFHGQAVKLAGKIVVGQKNIHRLPYTVQGCRNIDYSQSLFNCGQGKTCSTYANALHRSRARPDAENRRQACPGGGYKTQKPMWHNQLF